MKWTDTHKAHLGTCGSCGEAHVWVSVGLGLCMGCRFKPDVRTLLERMLALSDGAQSRVCDALKMYGWVGPDWRRRAKAVLRKVLTEGEEVKTKWREAIEREEVLRL